MRNISKGLAVVIVGVLTIINARHFAFAEVQFSGNSSSTIQVGLTDGSSSPLTYWAFSTSTNQATTQCIGSNNTTNMYGLFDVFGIGSGNTCFPSLGLPAVQDLPNGTYYVLESYGFPYVWSFYGTLYVFSGAYDGVNVFGSRIISWLPATSTVATGTNVVGFTAYIAPSDYVASSSFTFNLARSDFNGSPIDQSQIFSLNIEATGTGMFNYSTTTQLNDVGNYVEAVSYQTPSCVFFGRSFCGNQIFASSTLFGVGGNLSFYTFQGTFQTGLNATLASTTADLQGACSPFSSGFSVGGCITGLVVPSTQILQNDLSLLRTQAPWGYGFRVYDILSTTTPVALPELVITVPGAGSLDLTPWDKLMGSGSIIAQASSTVTLAGVTYGDGKSLRDITEPYWDFAWYLALILVVLHDITGIGRVRHKIK